MQGLGHGRGAKGPGGLPGVQAEESLDEGPRGPGAIGHGVHS